MAELKRRKLGGRRFLREMPWYVIIGPPAAGKTTALRQSGLDFPFDLTDDLQGVGGTRNCDWFFTEDGGADRHRRPLRAAGEPARGRRRRVARLPRPPEEAPRPPRAQRRHRRDLRPTMLAEGDAPIRAHGREIRKRLAELDTRLEIRLPVYLLVTKADLVQGLRAELRRASPPPSASRSGARPSRPASRSDGGAVGRELAALVERLEGRVGPRMEAEEDAADPRRDLPLPGPGREPRARRSGSSSTPSSARAATRRAPGCAAST